MFAVALGVAGTVRAHGEPLEVQARGEAELGRCVVFLQQDAVSAADSAADSVSMETAGEADSASAHPVSQHFEEHIYPRLRDRTAELRIPLQIVNVLDGAPPEITTTPAILFQNYRGRSVFQGEFDELGRAETFLRTGFFVAQEQKTETVRNVAVVEFGRARLAVRLRITGPSRDPEVGTDVTSRDELLQEAASAVRRGFEHLEWREEVELHRTDRLYLLSLTVSRSAPDSIQIFGELSSRSGVSISYLSLDDSVGTARPWTSAWGDRDRLLAEAGRELEQRLLALRRDPSRGAGFEPVPSGAPVRSWSELSLDLPTRPPRLNPVAKQEIVREWKLARSERDRPPQLVIHLAEPDDRWRAICDALDGELRLGQGPSPGGSRGVVVARLDSIETGYDGWNRHWLQSAELTASGPIERATLQIEDLEVAGDSTSLHYGVVSAATLRGVLRIGDSEQPIAAPVELEPVVDHHGNPVLLCSSRFRVGWADPPAWSTFTDSGVEARSLTARDEGDDRESRAHPELNVHVVMNLVWTAVLNEDGDENENENENDDESDR